MTISGAAVTVRKYFRDNQSTGWKQFDPGRYHKTDNSIWETSPTYLFTETRFAQWLYNWGRHDLNFSSGWTYDKSRTRLRHYKIHPRNSSRRNF